MSSTGGGSPAELGGAQQQPSLQKSRSLRAAWALPLKLPGSAINSLILSQKLRQEDEKTWKITNHKSKRNLHKLFNSLNELNTSVHCRGARPTLLSASPGVVGFPPLERFQFTHHPSALLPIPITTFCLESTSEASSRTALPPASVDLLPA